ncbi:hypothetical protein DTO166G4_2097 [Paecilomyces variotii]|nr:hypothetical protein DTO166G4_2097 [Paecilomyces variotii]KAJ9234261.1 hypothetical protein DTO166G5_5322 [Paecilomyces variotii]KAJ9362620.1 hypothetical protein DTO027B9_297 [Paecilomyces variotii]KAJ9363824.1 hypothetical protein DTO280E4_2046 [Paecilomyces variotii]
MTHVVTLYDNGSGGDLIAINGHKYRRNYNISRFYPDPTVEHGNFQYRHYFFRYSFRFDSPDDSTDHFAAHIYDFDYISFQSYRNVFWYKCCFCFCYEQLKFWFSFGKQWWVIGRNDKTHRGPTDASAAEGFLCARGRRHSVEERLGKGVKKDHSRQQSESSTVPSGTSDYEKKASPSLGSPGKAGGGRLMTTLEEDPCPLLASNPVIPTAELPASIPSRPDTTPELADTGRSPGRSELPPHADRELINIPIEARANARSWRVNRNHGPVTSNQAHIKTTRDGAIMRPNMNHESEEDTPSSYLRERGHIMSFMQYGNYNGTPPNSEAGSQRPTPIPQIEISPPMQDDAEGRESGTMPSSSSHRVGLGLSGIYMRQT